ncbi:threonine/serine dehydratase [Cytophagales bacterium RKSG123]|nr:threonine/serine dehydratase [Xanthovirga aplysinae]
MHQMYKEVEAAYARIKPYIYITPLEFSPSLEKETGAKVYLKLENQQRSGSFKLRGAMNKILSTDSSEVNKTFVAASTGNHAAGFADAVSRLGYKGKVFLPETVTEAKLQALEAYGIPLEIHGNDSVVTEAFANQYAEENDCILVHPYNDPYIIAGQGTIAIELLEEMDKIDAVFVPIGGGGIISGISSYLKKYSPKTKIIGCQPENAREMVDSVAAGRIVEPNSKPTLSDATAGGIEEGAITFEIIKEYVDEFITLTEGEIRAAILFAIRNHSMLIEGASALTLASLLKSKKKWANKNVVCVVTGKKLSFDILRNLLTEND